MFEDIKIQRLSVWSVYKVIAIALSCSFVPFSLLMGVFSLFGAKTVTWNNQHLIGWSGLFASPFLGVFLAFLFTVFLGTFCVFGLWLYSKIKPLTLTVKPVEQVA